jgi:hypothetical protein
MRKNIGRDAITARRVWNTTRLATAAAYALWLSDHNNAASEWTP